MASVPANAKQPQDHKTAKSEAKGKDTTVIYGEREYIIPSDALDNVEILEWIEDEKYIKAIRAILGKDQWNVFKEDVRDPKGHVPVSEFEPFITEIFTRLGNS